MFSLHFASSIESYSTLCQSSEHCLNLNSTLEEIQSTNSTPNPCLWPRYIDTVSMITVKCYLEKPAASAKTIHFHFKHFCTPPVRRYAPLPIVYDPVARCTARR